VWFLALIQQVVIKMSDAINKWLSRLSLLTIEIYPIKIGWPSRSHISLWSLDMTIDQAISQFDEIAVKSMPLGRLY